MKVSSNTVLGVIAGIGAILLAFGNDFGLILLIPAGVGLIINK